MQAILMSLNIGKILELGDKNSTDPLKKAYKSAIIKNSIKGALRCESEGFVGDFVADTKHHGGRDKAVFANACSNYAFWEEFLGLKNMPLGGMGENLSIKGLDETSVYVGDWHQIGSIVLEVSQPRKPCFTLCRRWGRADFAKEIFKSGRGGWYYRVVQTGECRAGDEIKIVKKAKIRLSIAQINREFYAPSSKEILEKIQALEAQNILAGEYSKAIKARLDNSYDDTYMHQA
ncbi:MOSC domain-containing protein [Campylobacter sp. 19-13652]|uniref:MOSC domain-containing protein n=1 Tax=Campylobacter sp. 19-13652 TaxID=2840180 RepID=UPI001C75FE3E|nr:MOSC domain-containing protein [Campylobacter sp. 19-13652]BCX79525.1 sulfurase [Campylobacter sp. 19-13652]